MITNLKGQYLMTEDCFQSDAAPDLLFHKKPDGSVEVAHVTVFHHANHEFSKAVDEQSQAFEAQTGRHVSTIRSGTVRVVGPWTLEVYSKLPRRATDFTDQQWREMLEALGIQNEDSLKW